MRQPLDPLPPCRTGGCGQHDDVEIGRAVGHTGLHHERSRCSAGLRWRAGEPDAALVDEIDEDRHRWQQRQISAIGVAGIFGRPPLIGQADAEDERIVVGRPALPEVFGQLGGASNDLGQVEVRAADALELGVVGHPDRVGGGDGRLLGRVDAGAAPAAPPGAVSCSTSRLGIDHGFVAWCSNEVELPQRGRLQRRGTVVNRTVEPKDPVPDAQSLLLPLRRMGRDVAVEVALVGYDDDAAGMLDDDLAARHQHLVEGQRCDVGPSRRAEGVAPRFQGPAVAAAFSRCLHEGDLGVAHPLDRPCCLDHRPGDQACGADQGAGRDRSTVDVHEVRWNGTEHADQQIADGDRLVDGVDRDLGLALGCGDDQVHVAGRGRRKEEGSGTDTGLMISLSVRQVHGITSKFKTTSSSDLRNGGVPAPRIDER